MMHGARCWHGCWASSTREMQMRVGATRQTSSLVVKPMAQGAGLVDLSMWNTDAAALVEQVRQAAVGTGFLQVYNHGISDAVIDDAFAASRSFFALPDEEKAKTPFVGWAGGWEKEKQARRGGVTNTTSAGLCLFTRLSTRTHTGPPVDGHSRPEGELPDWLHS